jgi:hypothetical protein
VGALQLGLFVWNKQNVSVWPKKVNHFMGQKVAAHTSTTKSGGNFKLLHTQAPHTSPCYTKTSNERAAVALSTHGCGGN